MYTTSIYFILLYTHVHIMLITIVRRARESLRWWKSLDRGCFITKLDTSHEIGKMNSVFRISRSMFLWKFNVQVRNIMYTIAAKEIADDPNYRCVNTPSTQPWRTLYDDFSLASHTHSDIKYIHTHTDTCGRTLRPNLGRHYNTILVYVYLGIFL